MEKGKATMLLVVDEMQQMLCELAPALVMARKKAEEAVEQCGLSHMEKAASEAASEVQHVVSLVQHANRIERMQAWLTRQLENAARELSGV